MKKAILLALISVSLSLLGYSQQKVTQNSSVSFASKMHNGYIRCATMEMDSLKRIEHPEFGAFNSNVQFINQSIKKHQAKHKDNLQQKLPILVIPVVIHVIHNGDALGSGENILDGQAISQVQVLNEDYRRILGTPGYNTNPVGADVEIEFCLAVIDPSGNPTTGVDHVNTGVASYNINASVETMKTNTIWDPTQYMNMWTVRFGGGMGGTLGYAQFPSNSGLSGLAVNGGAANTDGVVASYDAMGSSAIFTTGQGGIYNPTYNLGRTMTHEVGHWLGLRHIWGDGGCGVDDFCADTPNSDGSNFGCANPPSCGSPDMVENYMDYTDDNCMNIFTLDQKSRIRQVMLNSPRRVELASSTKCTAPNADDGGISVVVEPTGSYCNVTSFDPIVTLNNYGNNNLTTIDIVYNVDGGASSTFSWSGTLLPGASINVTLPTIILGVGTHTFNVSTNLPNGNVDANMGNDGTSSNFIINAGNPVDLSITTDCWGYETFWEIKDATNTLIYSGGNTGTTIPPGGGGTATAGDAGAYLSQTTLSGTLCLATGCYDFIIYDDFGDGLEGIAAGNGCTVDGTYSLTDPATANILASYSVFTNSQTTNFCIGTSCTSDAGTMNTTALSICGTANQTAIHNGDETNDGNDALQFVLHDGSGTVLGNVISTSSTPTFGFIGGMSFGTTYYISAIEGDDLGSGVVDQSDVCLSVATGTPVVWNNLPTVIANSTDVNPCLNNQITLTGSGANSYVWNNGVTNGVPTNPLNTTYIVTGTDVNGCTNTDNIIVTVNALPIIVGNSTANIICSGDPITLTGSGGSTYVWDNGATNGVIINPTSSTNYTVTGTDINGCVNTDVVAITVNALPTVIANSSTASICPGNTVTLTGSGANTYTWNNSVTNSVPFSPVSTNTYTVTGTDGNGCIGTDNITVTVNSLPNVVANSSSNPVCLGSTVILTGSGATSYTWDNNVTNGVAFNLMSSTIFTVVGTDLNGCTNTDNISLTVSSLPIVSNVIETCNGVNTAYTVSFDVSGGAGGYVVSGQSGSFSGSTWTSSSILSGTAYSITITDGNGCSPNVVSGNNNCACTSDAGTMNTTALSICGTGNQTATHNGDETLDGNDALEFVLHDGSSATLGNVIATSPTPIFGFSGGMVMGNTYYISAIVGDNLGGGVVDQSDACLSVSVGTPVVWNVLPTVTINSTQNAICNGDAVTLTGNGAVSYVWDNNVTNNVAFNPSSTLNYTVIGTNANNCSNTANITITVNALPSVVANSSALSICTGDAVTLTGSGGLSYVWSNSVVNAVPFNPTSTLNYTVTGTDLNGCSNTDNISVSVNSLPTIIANASNTVICNGDAVILSGAGGVNYLWNNSVVNAVPFNPSTTLNYVVTGTDVNGCSNTDNVLVTVNPSPQFILNSSNPTTCGGNDGVISIIGLDNMTSYIVTYTNGIIVGPTNIMSNGTGQLDLNNLSNGTYTDITVELNGCATINNSSTILTDPSIVNMTTIISDETCSNANAQIDITATGGSGVYQYSNDNGASFVGGNVFNGLTAGTYDLIAIDDNNCQALSQVIIVDNTSPVINNFTINDVSCFGGADGAILIDASGSTTLSYANNGGVGQNVGTFNGLTIGNYSIVITDLNGCTTTQSGVINEPTIITSSATIVNSYCGNENGSIALDINGGASPYSINWQFDASQTNDTITNLNTGNYIYTVIDDNGCVLEQNSTIEGSTAIVIELSTKNESCEGEQDGVAEVISVTGGSPSYNYDWDTGNNTAIISDLSSNVYQVTVTDQTGCTAVKTIVISVDSDECLEIHNAISPNGDGDNDNWVIKGIKGKEGSSVQIFNRWGSLIYESFNYQNDWKGTYKNKDLPAGVYYYIVKITEDEVYKGALTILR